VASHLATSADSAKEVKTTKNTDGQDSLPGGRRNRDAASSEPIEEAARVCAGIPPLHEGDVHFEFSFRQGVSLGRRIFVVFHFFWQNQRGSQV